MTKKAKDLKEKICINCQWFYDGEQESRGGVCRKRAPILLESSKAGFPTVNKGAFCGEHMLKEPLDYGERLAFDPSKFHAKGNSND